MRTRLSQAVAGAGGPRRRAIALGLCPGRPPDVPAGRASPVAGAPPHEHGCPTPPAARGRPLGGGGGATAAPSLAVALAHNQPPRAAPAAAHSAAPPTARGWCHAASPGVARLCGGPRLGSAAPPALCCCPPPTPTLRRRCPPPDTTCSAALPGPAISTSWLSATSTPASRPPPAT